MRKLTRWVCKSLRISRRTWRTHQPINPRHGFSYVPPAVYRHLREIGYAMSEGDTKRVKGLQMLLAKSGYEVPTTFDEVAEIYERIENQVNIR